MNAEKQNAEFTFKYNRSMGRHGWLRLTPAYSVKIVEQILGDLDYKPKCVLEPFSGTGTTGLVCANLGIKSISYDVNPFLIWLAKTKTTKYTQNTIDEFLSSARQIVSNISAYQPCKVPAIYNIERWWHKKQLDYLSRLKTAIWSVIDSQIKDLLKIAFCRVIIELSNAAFNHVSTSFSDKEDDNSFSDENGNTVFLTLCQMVGDTAQIQPQETAVIIQNDSTCIAESFMDQYDTIITSPPYPNRISYIRELRPYMYWLDYLHTSDDAGELDWGTIGGTWGAATSKLSQWTKKTDLLPAYLMDIADKIASADNKSAGLMANYVLKYFDDMAMHMESAFHTIAAGGTVHYIVGNSNFYGNTVPSDELYKDILKEVGFTEAKSTIIRKRNCNKALYEYRITAKK